VTPHADNMRAVSVAGYMQTFCKHCTEVAATVTNL